MSASNHGSGRRQYRVHAVRIRCFLDQEDRPLLDEWSFGRSDVSHKPLLPHRRVDADLEHVAQTVGAIDAAAVPDAVMQEQQRARRTHDVLLPADVLVTRDRRFADHAQMRAGNETGAAHLARHVVRVVHDLNVERAARIDRRILVRVLRNVRQRRALRRTPAETSRAGSDDRSADSVRPDFRLRRAPPAARARA